MRLPERPSGAAAEMVAGGICEQRRLSGTLRIRQISQLCEKNHHKNHLYNKSSAKLCFSLSLASLGDQKKGKTLISMEEYTRQIDPNKSCLS